MNVCPICSKPSGFKSNGFQKIYCSNECKSVDKRTGKMVPCQSCGKEIYFRPCDEGVKKYCSKICTVREVSKIPRKRKGKIYECPTCKNEIYLAPSQFNLLKTGITYCSKKCKGIAMQKGETPFGFKNEGATQDPNRYPRIQVNGKRVKEHRYVMETHLKRKLSEIEHVHHLNGDPTDNRIENLQVVSPIEHGKIHKTKK